MPRRNSNARSNHAKRMSFTDMARKLDLNKEQKIKMKIYILQTLTQESEVK